MGVHLALIEEIPCNVENMRIPNGMRFHVIDVYVDEMERVGALGEGSEAPVERLLEPLRGLVKSSPTKPVRVKALEDERLPGNEKDVGNTEKEDDGWGGITD